VEEFNTEKARESALALITDSAKHTVIVLDTKNGIVGCLAGTAFTPLFSTKLMGTEVFFYIKSEYRTAGCYRMLLKAFKYWCRLANCSFYYTGKMKGTNHPEQYTLRRI
jgi:hypothetical protein